MIFAQIFRGGIAFGSEGTLPERALSIISTLLLLSVFMHALFFFGTRFSKSKSENEDFLTNPRQKVHLGIMLFEIIVFLFINALLFTLW